MNTVNNENADIHSAAMTACILEEKPDDGITMVNGKPWMLDAKGNLVPLELVKPADKLEDVYKNQIGISGSSIKKRFCRCEMLIINHTFKPFPVIRKTMGFPYKSIKHHIGAQFLKLSVLFPFILSMLQLLKGIGAKALDNQKIFTNCQSHSRFGVFCLSFINSFHLPNSEPCGTNSSNASNQGLVVKHPFSPPHIFPLVNSSNKQNKKNCTSYKNEKSANTFIRSLQFIPHLNRPQQSTMLSNCLSVETTE